MAAESALIQLIKFPGSTDVTERVLPTTGAGNAFAFFGDGGIGPGQPYSAQPSSAQQFPVRPGFCSYEVWLAARFLGFGFNIITNVNLYFDTLDFTGMGTPGVFVFPTLSPLTMTGVHARVEPGAIQKGLSTPKLGSTVPTAAPELGLPVLGDGELGWPLFDEGPADGTVPSAASPTNQPEVLPLTPLNPNVTPTSGPLGKGILAADPEPRYSNFGVLVLVLAKDASAGIYSPATLALTWDEG